MNVIYEAYETSDLGFQLANREKWMLSYESLTQRLEGPTSYTDAVTHE